MGLSKTGRLNPAASGSVRPTDEDEFRIRPRKPKNIRETATALACVSAMRAAQRIGTTRPVRLLPQRCSINLTYSLRTKKGRTFHWARHGGYISRQSATKKPDDPGFDAEHRRGDLPQTLKSWQDAGDRRMYKIIVSPERGADMDVEKLARDLMRQTESDLGRPLEWVAAAHYNTDHPHVHIALRSIDHNGERFQIQRDQLLRIRQLAVGLTTEQLGPRRIYDQSVIRRNALIRIPPQLSR